MFHYLCMRAKSFQSCLTLQPYKLQPTRLHCPGDSPGKNTGGSCHFLLQGTFPGIEPGSLMSAALADGFFTTSATGEALQTLTVQFSSVAQSCPTLCDPMNRSTPGLPAHHQLPELTQTHVHRVRDAIQPSHPRSSPSPPAPNPSQHQSLFQ